MLENLQRAIEKPFHCFSTNYLVTNDGERHLLTSFQINVDIHISNAKILKKERVQLPRVNLEGRLNFDFSINTSLNKASKKYHALVSVYLYMSTKK